MATIPYCLKRISTVPLNSVPPSTRQRRTPPNLQYTSSYKNLAHASELAHLAGHASTHEIEGSVACNKNFIPPKPSGICIISKSKCRRIPEFQVGLKATMGQVFERSWQMLHERMKYAIWSNMFGQKKRSAKVL